MPKVEAGIVISKVRSRKDQFDGLSSGRFDEHNAARSLGFVNGQDNLYGPPAFLAIDHGRPLILDGLHEVLKLLGVPRVGDGGGVAGTTGCSYFLGETFTRFFVFGDFWVKRPLQEVFLFDEGGSLVAVNRDGLGEAGVHAGGGQDNTEGAVLKTKAAYGGVFDLDAFVGQQSGEASDMGGRPHHPKEQIDVVNGLVHEGAAAVEGHGSPPTSLVVILLGPPPFASRLAQRQSSEPASIDGSFESAIGIGETGGENRAQLDPIAFARLNNAVTAFQGDFKRFLDNDMLTRFGRGNGRLHVRTAGG